MSNYAETKKALDRIRDKYGCKGELIFRTALQYIVEYGQNKFHNDEWIQEQLILIDGKHDEAEAEGKNLWISREFEKLIIECAQEIAQVDTYNLLVYTQREVWLSNDGGIDYKRAIDLLRKCMAEIEQNYDCNNKDVHDTFYYIGLTDDEIQALGFGYVFDYEEDEDENC